MARKRSGEWGGQWEFPWRFVEVTRDGESGDKLTNPFYDSIVSAGNMGKFIHIELYIEELQRLKNLGYNFSCRLALVKAVEEAGMEDLFDMYCQRCISEADGKSMLTWTSLLARYLVRHKSLLRHRDLMKK